MLREGLVTLAFDCRDHVAQLEKLARRYADRRPNLADLCLIRMSELFPHHSIITTVRDDFKVYRRNTREVAGSIVYPVNTTFDSLDEETMGASATVWMSRIRT